MLPLITVFLPQILFFVFLPNQTFPLLHRMTPTSFPFPQMYVLWK